MKIAAVPMEFSSHRAAAVILKKENTHSETKMVYGDDKFIGPAEHPDLPRLAYICDLPVADFGNSPKIMMNLLSRYPRDRLRVLVSNWWEWPAEKLCPAWRTEFFPIRWKHLNAGRLFIWQSTERLLSARRRAAMLLPRLKNFAPEAVLTIAAGPSWLTAAEVAEQLKVPFHLIIHDHWESTCATVAVFNKWLERQFARTYRVAKTRFCVSRYMAQFYGQIFGVGGTELLPCRAAGTGCEAIRIRPRSPRQFTVAYAGSVANSHYVDLLIRLAGVLQGMDGRVIVYPLSIGSPVQTEPMLRPNIELKQSVPSTEVGQRLAINADVLFVPMSFDPSDAVKMRVGFPSKMADYTATGLPLLIWGPAYCSAVRWGRENPGVAEVIDTLDEQQLKALLIKLKDDPAHRLALAERAMEVGERLFSQASVWKVFSQALSQ